MTPVLARVTVFAVFERAPRAIHVPCRRLSLRPCLRIDAGAARLLGEAGRHVPGGCSTSPAD
jgi:hypothetical protein